MKASKTILAAALAAFAVACGPAPAWTDYDKEQLQVGEGIAVVPTEYGQVQGYILRDVYTFMGIPYGHETSGEYRFMPPAAPEPWEGVKPAVFYGASCPQGFYDRRAESFSAMVDHWNYDVLSEDCLRLNVWTPGINDSGKRPVLVWLHGGGFSKGNSMEQDSYSGENLSRYGNVVFCSVNHRLNSLGYSDFASVGGEKYRRSGNVGMLDIVAALQWVRNNIEAFGGDPDNVTIMGQSGGGSKVCMLNNMPTAKGLFSKAVALSGNAVRANSKAYAEALGEQILKEAGLTPDRIDELQQMPYGQYQEIADRAAAKMKSIPGQRGGFAPVGDGIDLPEGEFFQAGDESVSDVPMLLCSTFHEWNPDRDDPSMEDISLEGVAEALAARYGDKAESIVAAYSENFPDCRPIEIYSMILSNRKALIQTADAKLRQTSPVYVAWFGKTSNLFDGRHRAFHCCDISFWFLNTDLMVTHTGGGIEPRKLSRKMADALLNFMRKGVPAAKGLPVWKQYSVEGGETMVLNTSCEMKENPDAHARASLN